MLSPGTPTQLVNMRVSAVAPSSKPVMAEIEAGAGDGSAARKAARQVYFEGVQGYVECPTYDRTKLGAGDSFDGPAIIEEWNSTIIVQPGHKLTVDNFGNLLINTEKAV